MDDTQASNKSTTDAGAKRKRRSSILKSHRPPRTPLSELEFNVATPTDTNKSRRVSFSRRTGVAEFVTNEATTTWKNFYEEHNKSLETSGNESVANAPRQMSIGHIGKRIFDQQFEEVEIVDIGGTLQPKSLAQDFHSSLNNLNITQQLALLECPTDDRKLTAPTAAPQNFELSAFTDHQSKIFGDDLSIPVMPEMTNPISINYSMQAPNPKNNCDDLDEIVKDLERSQVANVVCPGPFNGDNMSEYIEVDLNMTHVAIKNDVCEMSITDTIRNPEVQEVSKSISSINNERKVTKEDDWIVDKENIAINPYIMPKESKNFNVNESSDKILVFDGKKLTVKSDKETIFDVENKDNFRKTLLPDLPTGATPKRKTIVLNTNDDLPNFVSDNSSIANTVDNVKDMPQFKQSIIYDECDLSITQALSSKVEVPKRKTIVFEDDMGNISITQAVPAKVIINKQEKRKTIIYENDNANISVTQAVPTNIMVANKTLEKRKTVFYEEDISFTQALPANLILNNDTKNKTMYYQDDNDISVTQAIPENIINVTQNKSINKTSNISITQAIPSNILLTNIKLSNSAITPICDAYNDEEIEITQAVYDNVLLSDKSRSEKRKTIVFADDAGDISVTQAVPANVVFDTFNPNCDKDGTLKNDENIGSDKLFNKSIINPVMVDDIESTTHRRRTIIYNEGAEDISMTQDMPSNIILTKHSEIENMDVSSDHGVADISITRPLPTNILQDEATQESFGLVSNTSNNCKKSYVNTSETKDFKIQLIEENKAKRQSELRESSGCNLSITKPIPNTIIDIIDNDIEMCEEKSLHVKPENLIQDNLSIKQDVFIYQAEEHSISQSKIESNVKCLPSNSVKESNKSLVGKEDYIASNSHVKTSTHALDNDKINDCYIEDNRSLSNVKFVNNVKCLERNQSITNNVDKNVKSKKSFLNELLDMSNASFENIGKLNVTVHDTKSQMVVDQSVDLNKSTIQFLSSNNDKKSNESLFFITKDSEDCLNDKSEHNDIPDKIEISHISEPKQIVTEPMQASDPKIIITESLQAIEGTEVFEEIEDLQSKIAELKAQDQQNRISNNQDYDIPENIDIKHTSDPKQIITEPLQSNNCTKEFEDSKDLQSKITEIKAQDQQKRIPNSRDYDIQENIHVKHTSDSKQIITEPLQTNKCSEESKDVEDLHSNITELKAQDQQKRISNNRFNDIPEKLDIKHTSYPKQITTEPLQANKYTEEFEDVEDFQSKITELKAQGQQKRMSNNRHYETVISSELYNDGENLNMSEMKEQNTRTYIKSIRNADNTQHLLEMLSDFTEGVTDGLENDKSTTDTKEQLEKQTDTKSESCESRISFFPKRQSIVLSREDLLHNISMAQAALQQSRFEITEDESIEETQESIEETQDLPEENIVEEKSRRNSVRISNDVVKTLQFEEDSFENEANQKTNVHLSPLKKTAFGETSYMREDKARVIPTYLKDVSDSIKALMTDLVKPTADVMPFESSTAKASVSTCSTEMQANLITSSQIDVDVELHSNSESIENIQSVKTRQSPVRVLIEKPASPNKVNKALSRSIQSEPVSAAMDVDPAPILITCAKHPIPQSNLKETTLVFDHNNPLNNVLLAPIDGVKVHKYNPIKSTETMHSEHDTFTQMSPEERNTGQVFEVERMSTHYNVGNVLGQSTLQSGDNCRETIKESNTLIANISKTLSVDRSTDGILSEVRSTEVNTLIAMKPNKELLEASSSLTLVDDALTRSEFYIPIYNTTSNDNEKKSPLRVIYKMETDGDLLEKIDSDAISNFETEDENDQSNDRKRTDSYAIQNEVPTSNSVIDLETIDSEKSNSRKRSYSPGKQNEETVSEAASNLETNNDISNTKKRPTKQVETNVATNIEIDDHIDTSNARKRSYSPRKQNDTVNTNIEVTPKPVNKMQKMSSSPHMQKQINDALQIYLDNIDSVPNLDDESQVKEKSPEKKSSRCDKVTVHHVSTDYKRTEKSNKNIVKSKKSNIKKAVVSIDSIESMNSIDIASSFTSSKDARGMQDVDKVSLSNKSSNPSSNLSIYWQSEDTSSNNQLKCSSTVNVVDQINVLKFMGRDCEWESSGSDVWMFRLLRSRIRITARLSHRHHNASRSRVLADTPLESVSVEPITPEAMDSLAALCVRLAAAAMRAECADCARAALVPPLLRRCARVARVALRWARVMRDARARLAYSVTADGDLTLKVANIPLRAVWEIRLRVALADAHDAGSGAYVRAEDVRVRAVLADAACAREPDVARLVASMPQDWRHAPATIWSVFRYLKNKTVNDDFLGL